MDDPLGVIYLFGCRLSAAPPDAKAQCPTRFPAADGGSGFSLVTPHRTYHLFAESAAEAAAWKVKGAHGASWHLHVVACHLHVSVAWHFTSYVIGRWC